MRKTIRNNLKPVVFICIFAVVLWGVFPAAGQTLSVRSKFSITGFYNEPFEEPMGVFVDRKNNEVYVADVAKGEIFVFDTTGAPLFKFGRGSGIVSPIDMAVFEDRLYLAQEGKEYVEILDIRGKSTGKLSTPPQIPFLSGRLDIDEEGNVYVVNRKLGECEVFSKSGEFLRSVGQGLFSLSGVAVGGDRVYLVAPFFSGKVIHVYGKTGEHLMSFEAIEGRGGTLGLPSSAKVDPEGNLWVVDSLRGVTIYDENAKKIGSFGGDGTRSERLEFPVDIDFDSSGMVYIIDKERKRLGVFK